MSKNTDVQKYISGVISGKIVTGELVKLSVQRHLNDLKNGAKRGLYFDEKAAGKAIKFFSFLKHSKGRWAGKPFDLAPWQQFIVYNIFGWKNRIDHTRRFRYSYTEISRKNGKTTLAAGIALYMMIADGESGAEVYTTASSHNQARICFDEAKNMVRRSSGLSEYVTVYQHNIHRLENASKLEPLSADTKKLEGLNPHCAIIDEYHVHTTTEMYDVMKSAVGARLQPHIFIITTAGFRKDYPCFRMRKTSIDILNGIKDQDNMFVMIHTLDEDDDWNDEKNWVKANPNLGVSVSMKYLREEYISAKNNPGQEEVNFKTKNLNMWTDASSVWIPDAVWMANSDTVKLDDLMNRECYLGSDISEKYDITALVAFFPPEKDKEKYIIIPFFWIPEDTVKLKLETVDYRRWATENFVTIVPGNTVDDDLIIEKIMELAELVDIQMLGYDEWNAKKFIIDLGKKGFDIENRAQKVTQYMSTLSEPTKKLYELAIGEKLAHGGNPVLQWMISNVELKRDTSNNIRIDKAKSAEKVDGISALINAICEYVDDDKNNFFSIS